MSQLSGTARNLQVIFKHNGLKLPLTDEMFEQFAKFYKFLMEYNKKYNLTRLTTFEEVAVKHFVDCIYVAQLTELPENLLDLGTGAGFPGVPLKIVSPQTRVILAEGVQKKVDFLKELREHLGLKGLDIIGRNVDPKMQYPVKGVITRAVELTESTLKNVANCLQTGGRVLLMKTPGIDEEIKKAQETFGTLFELTDNIDYKLGNTSHSRKLLIYKKTRPNTPETKP
jgi:16S rRNA (guanine(527)-N(7))-methyltransferase RsmG